MAEHNRILVVTTGGTIDALYDPKKGTPYHVPLPPNATDTCIPEALNKLGFKGAFDHYPLCMLDSKKITPKMIDNMLNYANEHGYQEIIFTCGTDQMPDFGRYIDGQLQSKLSNQTTVLLTGSLYPMRKPNPNDETRHVWRRRNELPGNDGWQHLNMAMREINHIKPGAYLEIGLGPLDPNTVIKEVELNPKTQADAATVARSGFVQVDRTVGNTLK